MTTENAVITEYVDDIAVIYLNRPEAMNAIDDSLRSSLKETLHMVEIEPRVRAIILTGNGERAFCAGQDLEESATIDTMNLAEWLNRQHAMYQAVRDLTKPIIAALNGTAVGAGFQISLMCDLRVGHPSLRMGQPEVKAGLASIVGSYLMSQQIGHSLNQELSLTGDLITGERAHALGLINDLVPADQVLLRALERARLLAALPRTAVRATKQRFRERTQAGFEEACNAGIRYQLECYATGEPQEVMSEFLSRRANRTTSHSNKD